MLETMGAKVVARNARTEIVLLALVAVAVRIAYKAQGMQFDAGPITWYWQFLEIDQLSRNLWQSLLHLHMQPPGLNALVAAGLKSLGPAGTSRGFELLFAALGVAMNLAFFRLIVLLTGNRPLAWTATLLVAANPVFMIYENQLFSTHLVATLMVLALLFLERTVSTGRIRWLVGYGLTLLTITLFRSMYHPLWWLAVFALGFLGLKPKRQSIAVGVFLFLAVLAWPLKNLVVFGRFTSSTWLGMNLYNTVYNQSYTPDEMQRYYAGEQRPFRRPAGARSVIGHLPPFSDPERYDPFISQAKTGVPVLDAPYRWGRVKNLNNAVYLKASDLYFQEYLDVVRADPAILLRVFASSLGAFFRPATDNEVLLLDAASRENLRNFHALSTLYDTVFYWRFTAADRTASTSRTAGVSNALILGYLLVMVWCPVQILRAFRSDRTRTAVLSFAWLNAVYVLLVGNLFENYENMRFRFEIEALVIFACAVALGDLTARLRRVTHGAVRIPANTRSGSRGASRRATMPGAA